jgi:2-polyprenyl-3-methyl-5-hydroxy-6-metoxy-1,4-benzoquinol methylase
VIYPGPPPMRTSQSTDVDARAVVEDVPVWYHTMQLAPGVVSPGYFDLRPIVDLMPWPEVAGRRCLDVGTYDGHLAFELERRGASEVIAVDLGSHEQLDWPPMLRRRGLPALMREVVGRDMGTGFRVAKELLGSSVERIEISAYELDPEAIGEFDVVVCGSLLLHLRDPLRALEAIRSVCRGRFLSAETIDLPLSVLRPRRAVMRLDGVSDHMQWLIPNVAGHVRMLESQGFSVERSSRPYAVPFGPGGPTLGTDLRNRARRAGWRLLAGSEGVPHHALLARAP